MLGGEWGSLIMAIVASSRLESFSLEEHIALAAAALVMAYVAHGDLAERFVINLVSALVSIWIRVLTDQEVLTIPQQLWNVVILVAIWLWIARRPKVPPLETAEPKDIPSGEHDSLKETPVPREESPVPKETPGHEETKGQATERDPPEETPISAYARGVISATSYMASVLLARLMLSRHPTPDMIALAGIILFLVWVLFELVFSSHKSLLWRPAALVFSQLVWEHALGGLDAIFVLAVVVTATATATRHKAIAAVFSTAVAIRASQTTFGWSNIYILALWAAAHVIEHAFFKSVSLSLRRTLVVQFVLFAILQLDTLVSLVLLTVVVSFLLDD